MKFVHLHTHSHYSLLDGLAKIDDLIAYAKELGMNALALTDHGNLYGAIEFYKKAIKAELKPILGVETYVAPRSRFKKEVSIDDKYSHLTLLAKNQTGWLNLIQLVTKANLEGFYYKPRVDKDLLREHSEGLIALSGCPSGEIPKLIAKDRIEEAEKIAKEYQEIFGPENFFLEVYHHPNVPNISKINNGLTKISQKNNIPLVATQDIHYLKPEDAEYQDILLAVQTGNTLNDDNRITLKADDFSMRSIEQMTELFKNFPGAVENTVKIADRCNVTLQLNKTLLPNFALPEGKNANQYLKELLIKRLHKRFQKITNQIKERLNYELNVIEKTGFADYFLIVQDIVSWAKERGIVVGPGRGSAAGSIVSYILGVTDIDPLKYGLLFERFLNPERISMPDIDIDFTDVRRDEVMSYVRQKYGDDHVAQIITFGTMAARAAIRDAGRALGMQYNLCDQLAKLIPLNEKLNNALENVKELNDLYNNNPDAKKILNAAKHLEGVARHASVHACGIVISKEPITKYTPLQKAPQNQDIIITQFEMHSVEDLGLLKMDFLGLKNLTIIEKTIRLIKEIKDEEIDISKIPLDDKKTFKLLQAGDTTAVFQLESSGMRNYLKQLKPTEFEDIISMISLYRPGAMEHIPQYIKRKHKLEKVVYLHHKLEPILKNTYGIGLYQEQMMRIAVDLAGFTLAEADILRKAIGKKIKSLLDSQKEKLIDGMLKNGIDKKIAKEIWELFPPFSRYGFNRSHGACYAMIGYQTAYLKAHYPIEFTTSLLNADSGNIERISFLVSESKKSKIEVLPPDINKSFDNFIPEGKKIRFGLLAIKNVGANIVEAIITERHRRGPFEDFTNFITRVQHKDLNKKSLESMIKTGVFDSFGIDRNTLLLNIEKILSFSQNLRKSQSTNQDGLFGANYHNGSLNFEDVQPATNKEKLSWEKELLGLYISDHPLNAHLKRIQSNKVKPIKELLETNNIESNPRNRFRIAGVISKTQKILTKLGQPMLFATIEDFNDSLETIVFADALAKNPAIWQENNVLIVQGRLSWRNNEPKLICEHAVEL